MSAPGAISQSLFEADTPGSVGDVVGWVVGVALGSVGVALAVVAVSVVGLALLSGRLAIRDGMRVILGCFVLFAAPLLATSLRILADHGSIVQVDPVSAPSLPEPSPLPHPTYDPYAGASLRDESATQ